MLIGDPNIFAIEVHHEPISNASKRVFGRMCIHTCGVTLGDIEEPDCMLNVTEGHLSEVLGRLHALEDAGFVARSDREAFDFLNQALYLDDERTDQEIQRDSERYFRFDFLTNGGESFDRTTSFITRSGEMVRLMFTDETETLFVAHVPQIEFRDRINDFFAWIEQEGRNVPV
jgi:hypothetical protein